MDIDSAVRDALIDQVGTERYQLWFGSEVRFELARENPGADEADGRPERLVVLAPTPFLQEWLRRNFRTAIEAAARKLLNRQLAVDMRLALPCRESTAGPEPEPRPPSTDEPTSGSSVSAGAGTNGEIAQIAGTLQVASLPSDSAKCDPSATLPVTAIARRSFARFESFVVGQTNRLAWTSGRMVTDRPGSLSPLLFYGPTGVGKTHLLEAIWSGLKTGPVRPRAVYLTAEQFTSYFVEALRGSGLPNFRRKYRGVDVLMIDDLQFFRGKRATLVELLYTINTLLEEGRQLVFTADRSPAELGELGRDLANRLQGGMVCRVDPPDYEIRLGIVRQLSAAAGLDLASELASFVAAQVTGDARGLCGAVNRLSAARLALGGPLTLAAAAEALDDLIRDTTRSVRLRDIEAAICDVFGLEPDSLQSARRTKNIAHPRMLAMFLARKHTPAALSEIGGYFGGRSHSTVLSAQQKVSSWMGETATVCIADSRLSIDEAIRRVEQRLLA